MATKFKFEIESDGLTVEQASAFSIFVKSLSIAVSVTNDVQAGLIKLAEIETTQSEEVEIPEPAKKKRASRAKAEEAISETPMQIDARNMGVIEEPQAEEPQAEEPQAEEPQAEEPQAEEPQAEEISTDELVSNIAKAMGVNTEDVQAEEDQPKPTKTSAFSIQDVRDRVKAKQVKWRTSIKAELERLGSSSVSLLDPKHFEEFCNFMDNLA